MMDSARFENANKLHDAGRIEDAARAFHALADETDDPDEKVAIFANAHKCYCQLGQLDKANALMHQIRSLPQQDMFVQMIVDFADACMMAQMGKLDEGALRFERVLDSNRELLASSDNRYLYEDIPQNSFAKLNIQAKMRDVAVCILGNACGMKSAWGEERLSQLRLYGCNRAYFPAAALPSSLASIAGLAQIS